MRKFTKRIIWFFGFWTLEMIDELIYHLTTGNHIKPNLYIEILVLAAWIIPLFFMKNDKEESQKQFIKTL